MKATPQHTQTPQVAYLARFILFANTRLHTHYTRRHCGNCVTFCVTLITAKLKIYARERAPKCKFSECLISGWGFSSCAFELRLLNTRERKSRVQFKVKVIKLKLGMGFEWHDGDLWTWKFHEHDENFAKLILRGKVFKFVWSIWNLELNLMSLKNEKSYYILHDNRNCKCLQAVLGKLSHFLSSRLPFHYVEYFFTWIT